MSDRFPVYETMKINPGCCYLCSGSQGPYVDTKSTEIGWGPVYICAKCIREMAQSLGLDDLASQFFSSRVLAAVESLPREVKELADNLGSRLSHLADFAGGLSHAVEESHRKLNEAFDQREREIAIASRRLDQETLLFAEAGSLNDTDAAYVASKRKGSGT